MKTKNKRIYVLSVECFQDILVMTWPQFTVVSSYSVCDNSTVTALLTKKKCLDFSQDMLFFTSFMCIEKQNVKAQGIADQRTKDT